MSDVTAALNDSRAPAPEDVALLQQRAAQLARSGSRPDTAERLQVVFFELAGERYALDATLILRVLTLRELTPLPGAAAPLFGVTQWRGGVLTLLDIRPVLGASASGLTDMGRVIVLEGAEREFGIVVDHVRTMGELDADDIRSLPDNGGAAGSSLLRGITQDGVFVIDGEVLLSRYGGARRAQTGQG